MHKTRWQPHSSGSGSLSKREWIPCTVHGTRQHPTWWSTSQKKKKKKTKRKRTGREAIQTYTSVLSLFTLSFWFYFAPLLKTKRKKEFDTFYFTPFIFVVVISFFWFCFARSSSFFKKEKKKSNFLP